MQFLFINRTNNWEGFSFLTLESESLISEEGNETSDPASYPLSLSSFSIAIDQRFFNGVTEKKGFDVERKKEEEDRLLGVEETVFLSEERIRRNFNFCYVSRYPN